MTKEEGHFRCYTPKKFNAESALIIDESNAIITEYDGKGFSLTLRQLYYQFVARGIFANVDTNYNRLGTIISDARLAGLVSWTAIVDRTRGLRGITTYEGPAQAIQKTREAFALDLWDNQMVRPEVWIEKDALVDVIGGICNELRVDYFASRGYNSQSAQWRAGQRLARYVQKGQRPIIFHLGDHDPSGLDMTRDNQDRLSMFVGTPIQVVRLALNMSQIEQYAPPPNPAKMSDSRAAGYVAEYGDSSWELDALDPQVISDLISDAILRLRDEEAWSVALAREVNDQEALDLVIADLGGGSAR